MLVDELSSYGVAFKSATEPFDTTTSAGKLMFQQLGSFAEFERNRIAERVFPGMVKGVQRGNWQGDVVDNNEDNYGTYETEDGWVTPVGEYNIIHIDCPTKDEIKKRVAEFIDELLSGEDAEEICPSCAMMGGMPYNVTYYCQILCHECDKAVRCKNFNSNSMEENEA